MRRWHEELPTMLKRWRMELHNHGYAWGDYIGPYLAGARICVRTCHCEKGPGYYRKKTPLGHSSHCDLCHFGKDIGMAAGCEKYGGRGYRFRCNREARALKEELAAYEPIPYRGPRRKVLPHAVRREFNEALGEYDYEWQPAGNGFRMSRTPKPYVWPMAFVETIRREAVREARAAKRRQPTKERDRS